MIFTLIFTVVVAIVAIAFSLENTTQIQISFFGYPVQGPEGLIMLITLGVGFLVGVIVVLPSLIGRTWKLNVHKRKLAKLEKDTSQGPPENEQ